VREGGARATARSDGTAFLLLVLAQAAHSLEECVFRLYDVFPPARLVSGIFSRDRATGFAVANVLLVLFGLWCYAARVRHGRPGSRALAWFWVALEAGNGLSHSLFALARGGYFPGVATAPLLLAAALYLGARLTHHKSAEPWSRPNPS
jgi:hypothetical protein